VSDRPEVLVVGETLIDFLPSEPGPLSEVETFSRRAGGAAANVAIALSRLDRAPYLLSNVSADGFGEFLLDSLETNDVATDFLTRDPVHETTLAFVSHDAAGDRAFTFHGTDTADGYLDSSAVPDDTLEELSWVCIDAPVALAAPNSREAIVELCERAHEHDCSVAFDPNTRRDLWPERGTFLDCLDRMLSLTDVCKTSPEDFRDTPFAADGGSELARNVQDAGPHTVFVTEGAGGASVHATERAPWGAISCSHSGYDVSTTDTTGAGDAFLAGVLAALLESEGMEGIEGVEGTAGIERVLGFANGVAALTTTEAGAIAALPDRERVRGLRESG
jgi:fructokinase